ncbi:porin [Thiothrix winogradskyi]|uniref:Porin n=1 Tax=Thiothrix winogradskyi TaxID=96472 RepID=A0ABY3T3C4_9GAMM|nr:porin [Thiothrix winogradskyi]UJS25739.1 porin [Thiothrix winogradskyi]
MKNILAIAVATALIAPAAAMAETTLYGKLHASAGEVKDAAGTKTTAVESHSSRFGIKGSTELNDGMSATYGLEYGLDIDGDNGGGAAAGGNVGTTGTTGAPLSARNTFVGLKGGFGEVRLGRHDTPAKLATAGLDVFADTYADMANIINADAHRVNNVVAYINKFGPVGFAAAHSTGIGSATTGDGSAEANSVMANYSTGPFYAGLGYTDVDGGSIATGTAGAGVSAAEHINLGLGYKAEAGHAVNFVMENSSGATAVEDEAMMLSGVAKMGAVSFKAAVAQSERSGAAAGSNGKEEMTAIGFDYGLGKKTSVYILGTENKNTAKVEAGATKTTATVLGVVTEF